MWVLVSLGMGAVSAWADIYIGTSLSGNAISPTDLTVTGNTIIGDSASDTFTVNASTVVVPATTPSVLFATSTALTATPILSMDGVNGRVSVGDGVAPTYTLVVGGASGTLHVGNLAGAGSPRIIFGNSNAYIGVDGTTSKIQFGELGVGGTDKISIGIASGANLNITGGPVAIGTNTTVGTLTVNNTGTIPLQSWWVNNSTVAYVDSTGANVLYQTASTPTAVASQCSIWASSWGATAEMVVQDGAGNATKISPHNPETGKWEFFSCNSLTNHCYQVPDMEKLISTVERLSGEKLHREWAYKDQ